MYHLHKFGVLYNLGDFVEKQSMIHRVVRFCQVDKHCTCDFLFLISIFDKLGQVEELVAT